MLRTKQLWQLKQAHPRIWNRSTVEQRKGIVARFEETGDVEQAYKGVRFSKVELSDLTFDSVGSRRMR